ncbi:MAG: sigma-70 family RNA polymerase sigma factor [Ruminococcus sp.]
MADFNSQQNLKTLTDSELARLVRQGSDSAFEEISKRYSGIIHSIAAKYSAAGFDRSDFMQEGLLALLSACKSFSSEGCASFRTYTALCISRRFMSVIRKAHAKGAIPDDTLISYDDIEISDQNTQNPETLFIEKESSIGLQNTIRQKLSPLELEVLRLYLQGLSYADISELLGKSSKSVDNALQRIRRKLISP